MSFLHCWGRPPLGEDAERDPERVGLPVIATVARLLCHTGRVRYGILAGDSSRGGSRSRGVPDSQPTGTPILDLNTRRRAFPDPSSPGFVALLVQCHETAPSGRGNSGCSTLNLAEVAARP